MEFHEFGDVRHPKLLLIHGLATTWQYCFESIIDELSKHYYLIIPALDGHDSSIEGDFTCLDHEVEQIEDYILNRYIPDLHGAFGFSMGGTILLKLMANQKIRFQKAILDAAYYLPLGIYSKAIATFLAKSMAEMQEGRPLHPMHHILLKYVNTDVEALRKAITPYITSKSIYRCVLQLSDFQLQKPISISTDITYWYGSKELFPPKSVKFVKELFPNVRVKIFENLGHGELIMKHPKKCIEEMRQFFA